MTIPLVFWLALMTPTASYGKAMDILPIPFGSYDDCETAGKQADVGAVTHACIQQRESDVSEWLKAQVGTYEYHPSQH